MIWWTVCLRGKFWFDLFRHIDKRLRRYFFLIRFYFFCLLEGLFSFSVGLVMRFLLLLLLKRNCLKKNHYFERHVAYFYCYQYQCIKQHIISSFSYLRFVVYYIAALSIHSIHQTNQISFVQKYNLNWINGEENKPKNRC